MSDQTSSPFCNSASRWWREPQLLFLLLLVVGIYFSRMQTLTLRGEETRRARVAVEMLESGEWIVPTQQGEIYLSRPPFQNWLIAGVAKIRGAVDVVAVRLPSALAIFLTVMLIYGYSRLFLSPSGAMLSGAAFCTFAQLLEIGGLGETEALFTLLVAGSLLLWHWGDVRKWNRVSLWMIPYSLVAIGCLTKGLQAPVYFVAGVGAFLLFSRRWKEAICWQHLLGITLFLIIWGSWQYTFSLRTSSTEAQMIYSRNIAERFVDTSIPNILRHLAMYPVEIFLACLMPWSGLLFAFCFPELRQKLSSQRSPLLFLLCSTVLAFISLWIVPGAQERYYMPLFPCWAIVIGFVVEACWQGDRSEFWARSWERFSLIMGIVCGVAGLFTLGAQLIVEESSIFWQPVGFALCYGGFCIAAALFLWKKRTTTVPFLHQTSIACVAIFMGLSFTGLLTNQLDRASERIAQDVQHLKAQIPPTQKMVSLNQVHHKFAYHYHDLIPVVPLGETAGIPAGTEWFCFNDHLEETIPDLGFRWEKVAVISCDRNQRKDPKVGVVIARRIPNIQTAKEEQTLSPSAL